jgi:opacity protein-like surface antigen
MKRTVTAIAAALIACAAAVAQEAVAVARHEVSISAGGALSGLQSRPVYGDANMKGAFAIGAGYHYALNDTWGILSGIHFAVYNGGIAASNNDHTQQITIPGGNPLDFKISAPAYSEKQRAVMINIPVMAQYRYRGWNKAVLYGAGGFKLGVPVKVTARPEGTYTTSSFSSETHITYEELPDYSLVSNRAFPEGKTDLGMKATVMMSLEAGAQWPFGGRYILYTGIYTDLGLNNALKRNVETVRNLVAYQSETPAQVAFNSATDTYAKRMSPFALGITVRWVFFTKGNPAEGNALPAWTHFLRKGGER